MYNTPEDRPVYRLLTGKDDRAFCERVSEALAQGWRLYGSPSMTYDGGMDCIKVAQAVVWHAADVVKYGAAHAAPAGVMPGRCL